MCAFFDASKPTAKEYNFPYYTFYGWRTPINLWELRSKLPNCQNFKDFCVKLRVHNVTHTHTLFVRLICVFLLWFEHLREGKFSVTFIVKVKILGLNVAISSQKYTFKKKHRLSLGYKSPTNSPFVFGMNPV